MRLTLQLGPNSREFLSGRRRLKLQVRVSPKAVKTKTTKTTSTRKYGQFGTGVAAAQENESYMESTDVSSPIRAASGNYKSKNRRVDNDEEYGDAPARFSASEDSEDDDFEPVREAGRRSAFSDTRPQLGPPITRDQRIDEANLGAVHQMIIPQFVIDAKKIEEKIRNEKGRRKAFFNEENLREMAINWTITVNEMMEIRDINTDHVKAFGALFLPLIQKYHDQYESMMRREDDRDIDENHQNVIVISTDSDDEDDECGQKSGYFSQSAEVQAFNESVALAGLQSPQQPSRTPPPKPKAKPKSDGRGGRGGLSYSGSYSGSGSARGRSIGRGDFRRGGRRGSGGFPKARSASRGSGVTKRKSGGKRPSNGSTASIGPSNIFKSFPKKDGGGGGAGGSGGIGMMPA
jgi:bloom syndrome protein